MNVVKLNRDVDLNPGNNDICFQNKKVDFFAGEITMR